MMRQRFTIPGRLAGSNDYIAAAHSSAARSRMKRENEAVVADAALAAGIVPMEGRVRVSITFYERPEGRQRARDLGNVFFGEKFIMDALVRLGIIKDDGVDFIPEESVHGYDCRKRGYFANKGGQRIEVVLEDMEG